MAIHRPRWQSVLASAGCAGLVVLVAGVAVTWNPEEGVNLADLTTVVLTAVALAASLLVWVRGSAAPEGGRVTPRDASPSNAGAVGVVSSQPVAGAFEVPQQLPAAVVGFAGREAELTALTALLEQPTDRARTVVISAVDGAAGIGKTALAVWWAHQVREQFPDGQLYVNLRGFDPSSTPMPPTEALRGFLDGLQVPADRIPIQIDAQASLYRSVLTGRRVLVILDNARDAAQVRPLLPGAPGCLVLVTSRTRLTSLIAAEGARPLTVDLLSAAEAHELLVRRLGAGRLAVEPQPAREIVALCARLPLALSIVAARAAMNPGFPLAAVADELRQARGGLRAFDGGEADADVRTVFSWTYQQLDAANARLFGLLGLHPGPDITAAAAASLAATGVASTRRCLAELARCHLVTEHSPGRFGFHDLLRAYAAELVERHETDAERQKARGRMLDHYLHTAHPANLLLHSRWDPVALSAPAAGVTPENLTNHAEAYSWFEAEYPVLLGAVRLAADTGHPIHTWQLPQTLVEFSICEGRWTDWAETAHLALAGAQQHDDDRGQAHAHRSLGRALAWLGRFDEAHRHLRLAIDLFAQLGDPTAEADCYSRIGSNFEQEGRIAEALPPTQRALELLRSAGSPNRATAQALNNIGWFYTLLGQAEQALTYCTPALALNREIGDRRGEANTLDSLGYAHHALGQYAEAIDHLQQAVTLDRERGVRHGLAAKLTHLGDAHLSTGNPDDARKAWTEALSLLDQLAVPPAGTGPGYPSPDALTTRLHQLDHPDDARR